MRRGKAEMPFLFLLEEKIGIYRWDAGDAIFRFFERKVANSQARFARVFFENVSWQKAFTKARERFSILQSEMGLILIISARAIVLQDCRKIKG